MSPRLRLRIAMTLLVLGVIASHIASPVRAAAIDVYLTVPPPPRPAEAAPAARAGYVWAPGYYAFRGGNFVWVNGDYINARPGYLWVADRWEEDRGRYRFIPGRWVR
jgi:hypothetical protein